MTFNVYSVLDRVAKKYGPLMAYSNDGEVLRALQATLWSGDSTLSKFPEDFSIYCLGSFDDENGVLLRLEVPRLVSDVRCVLDSSGQPVSAVSNTYVDSDK